MIFDGSDIYEIKNYEENKQKLERRLIVAAQNGSYPQILAVLASIQDEHVNVNYCDEEGWTALMWAAAYGHYDIVTTLISTYHASVNQVNMHGWSALSFAAEFGHVEIVQFLIHHGAIIDSTDLYGMNVLMSAAREGHSEIVELLINKGANCHQTDMHGFTSLAYTCISDDATSAQLLLTKGVDVNAIFNFPNKLCESCTVLILAAMHGRKDIVKLLIEAGANLNASSL